MFQTFSPINGAYMYKDHTAIIRNPSTHVKR